MMHPALAGSPRIKFNSTLNVVCDGNSLFAGQGGGQNIPRVLAKTAPFSATTHPISQSYDATQLVNTTNYVKWQTDKSVTVLNIAISGQTWRKMNGLDGYSAADVDGAWVAGKTNVLILWEGTNSISSGRTAAQAIQDATDYITARQAAVNAAYPGKRWIILVGTCLPRQNSGTDQTLVDTLNATIDSYNALLRAQYKTMGAHGLFDVRQEGSPFNWYMPDGVTPDYRIATFEANCTGTSSLWQGTDFGWPSEAGAHTHLNSNGYVWVDYNCIIPAAVKLLRRYGG